MSETQPLSSEFIRQICATYQMHEPLIDAAMKEHRELRIFIIMLRAALETSDESNPEFNTTLTRIITHMDTTMDMLKRIQSFTKQADMVMKEHQV